MVDVDTRNLDRIIDALEEMGCCRNGYVNAPEDVVANIFRNQLTAALASRDTEVERLTKERDFARNSVVQKCRQYDADMIVMRDAINREIAETEKLRGERPSEELAEWFAAHDAYHKASDTYNARVRFMREQEAIDPNRFGTFNSHGEYQLLNEAQKAALKADETFYSALAARAVLRPAGE